MVKKPVKPRIEGCKKPKPSQKFTSTNGRAKLQSPPNKQNIITKSESHKMVEDYDNLDKTGKV